MRANGFFGLLVVMAVLAGPTWSYAFSLEEMGLPSQVAQSITFVQVRDTQANSGDVVLRAATGCVINAEGYVLTSSEPFGERSKSNRSVRLQVAAAPFGAAKANPMELIFLDASLGIALLKPKDDTSDQPFLRVSNGAAPLQSSVTIAISPLGERAYVAAMRDLQILGPAPDDVRIRGQIDMPESGALVGAPVLQRDTWRLLGVVSGIDMNGTVELVPASALGSTLKLAKVGPPTSEGSNTVRSETVKIQEEQTIHLSGPTKKPYQRTYVAPEGYRIADTSVMVGSSNGLQAQPFVKIDEDKKTATVQFVLESGPAWDRKRGWLEGELRVDLVPQSSPPK